MQKRYRMVGLGGTFDELHKGHKTLLIKAFEIGQKVTIGVSSDSFVKRMDKPHTTAPYVHRTEEVQKFLSENGFMQRAEIIPIDDAYGGMLLSKGSIEALIVSKETASSALRINEKRRRAKLPQLDIIVINMVPSENRQPISTTRIRRGEIDREGHQLEHGKKVQIHSNPDVDEKDI